MTASTSLHFVLSLCLAVSLTATQAGAQNPPAPADAVPQPSTEAQAPAPATSAPPPAADQRKTAQEEITVTGSRIRRKDLTTPAPVAVLTREQFEASGKATIGEFLQMMPEQGNAPNFQLNNGGATYGADGATRVNLRSLGVTRTLVLVNGRRMVTSGLGASSSVDLNTIPTAAVERVEVLKDGGSAIYGSDAIAGVVNVITRKSFNGTQASAQYGISQRGDAQTFDANVTTGRSGDLGNFMFSAGYFNQKDSWLRDRDWSQYALDYDFTTGKVSRSGSGRVPEGNVGLPQNPDGTPTADCLKNPLCNYLVTQLDAGNWTNDSFIHDPNAPHGWRVFQGSDRYNFAAENYLTIPTTRVSVYSAGDTRFSAVRGYYETSYVQHTSQENAAPMPLNPGDYNLSVSKDSMYNPFGVDLPFAGRRLVEFGHRTYSQDLATFRIVTGLDGQLPEQFGPLNGWSWDVNMNYGRTTGTFETGGAIRNSKIADAVGPSAMVNGVPTCLDRNGNAISGCVPLNLFGGANNGSIDPSQIEGLGFTGTSRAFDALFSVGANAGGDLFTLAADRPASLAIGYEFRRQSGAQIADPIAASGDSADFNFKSTNGFYTVHEAYGELLLPLLSNIEGVKDLEASLAGRYVNYNTFGDNFSYKAGARYTPIQDVTLRGTYSTAFRAPSINELYLGQSETAPLATDPCNDLSDPARKAQCIAGGVPAGGSGDNGFQELARVGGNSKLQPETAKVFTAGVVIEPRWVKNLSFTVDFYHVDVDNVIGSLGVQNILDGCYSGSARASYQPYCDLVHRSSAGRILFVEDVNQNVGQLSTEGLDFAARYALPTEVGRFSFGVDGTWLSKYDRTTVLATGSTTFHGKGNYDLGALPALKVNAGVNWSFAGFTGGVLGRYVGNFKECANASDPTTAAGGLCNVNDGFARDVGHNIVVDLHAGYTLKTDAGQTSLVAGVTNLFDQAPQYVYSAALANSDPSLYDYLGRYVYGRVQHRF